MATGRQCLRAKAHNLPRGHNGRQHKCYDVFVFFGFKGKHSHSPSQQVSQNIFAIRVARVIISKKQVYFSPTPPHFPQKHPFLFSNSPLTAHAPLAADFLPRRCAPPSHARTRTRPHHRVSHFLPSPFTPLSQATIYQVLTTQKQGEHKAKKAFTPSAPNDKPCVGS